METQTQKTTHTIDATGKSVGRIATEAVNVLRGKNSTSFVRNQVPFVRVHITNAAQVYIPASKRAQKIYKHYTGHPGGLKEATMEEVIEKKGYGEIFEHAIYGMLPGNKLRKQMMKNVTITE